MVTMILGIDEVGRGPWAGPLVVGAVVLGGEEIEGLTDSKKLSKKRREELDSIIREKAAGYGLGWVAADEIDTLGLASALQLACKRALMEVDLLGVAYHEIIIDGTINFLKDTSKGGYVTTMKKADLLVPSVSAASIIAKVARDNYMAEQDAVYEGYKFSTHVGYGTAIHRAAIEELGVTPLHRLSFAPLAKYRVTQLPDRTQVADVLLSKDRQSPELRPSNYMGAVAEASAAIYLQDKGHEIIERNWKTRFCEIDIVSIKNDTIHFTEVKYRKTPNQGGGLAAITKKKLGQMTFAAKVYIQTKKAHKSDIILAVMSLTGDPPEVETYMVLDQ